MNIFQPDTFDYQRDPKAHLSTFELAQLVHFSPLCYSGWLRNPAPVDRWQNSFSWLSTIQGGAGFRNHPQYVHNLPFILFNYLSSVQNPCVIPLNPGWFIGIPRSWVIAVPNIFGRFG